MVKHHVKKKKQHGNAKKQEADKVIKEKLSNLDRFGGSSDEEESQDDHRPKNHDVPSSGDESQNSDDDDENSDPEEKDENFEEKHESKTQTGEIAAEMKLDVPKTTNADAEEDSESDASRDEWDEVEEDDEEDEFLANANSKSLGMANAMARILGPSATNAANDADVSTRKDNSDDKTNKLTAPEAVVLSKTVTKLQKAQMEEKLSMADLKRKRKLRKKDNLVCMHIPLLVVNKNAKKAKVGKSAAEATAVSKEIEIERTHRRIATRGVVALFNAISKHRAETSLKTVKTTSEGGEKKASTQNMTKLGFLEMLKESAVKGSNVKDDKHSANTASSNTSTAAKEDPKQQDENKKQKGGWNALKDDFMMGSNKLRDWDKDDSDSGTEDEQPPDFGKNANLSDDDGDDFGEVPNKNKRNKHDGGSMKRRKVSKR